MEFVRREIGRRKTEGKACTVEVEGCFVIPIHKMHRQSNLNIVLKVLDQSDKFT